MSYPAVAFLRQRYPSSRLTVLARPWVADVFRHSPHIDDVLIAPKTGGMGRLLGLWRETRLARRGRPRLAYILPNAFSAALPTYLAGIKQRVGFATDARARLLTHPVPLTPDLLTCHQVYYYLRLVGHEPGTPLPSPPRMYLTQHEHDAARQTREELSLPEGAPYITLVPGANYGTAKRWFPGRYVEIGRRLVQRRDVRVLVMGSPVERELCETIADEIGAGAHSLAGRTDVRHAAALVARAALCLTNDTGLMHVAAAVNTPVVAIFGSTDRLTTAPFGEDRHGRSHVIVQTPVDCNPCLLRHCPIDHRCMERVDVEQVWRALETSLV